MRFRFRPTLPILALTGLAICSPLRAELYRWVDESGRVHFSDSKPSQDADHYQPESQLSTFSNVYFQRQPKPDYSDLPPMEQRRDNPDLEKLQKIRFPEVPNDANIAAYIQQIYSISRLQKRHLKADPQVSMLMLVGSEYLHVLIRETYSHVGWHNYGIEVIKRLAGDKHKAQIRDALKQYSKYAKVVYAKGWHHEFKNTLIGGLRNNRGYLPADWIRAVSEFDDPAARQLLIEYFKHGWNNHSTYQIIAGMEGIGPELDRALPQAWETARENNRYALRQLTPRALELGYRPAFKYIMAALADEREIQGSQMDPQALALRFTDQSGSPQQIQHWYQSNQYRIKFDRASKQFRVQ